MRHLLVVPIDRLRVVEHGRLRDLELLYRLTAAIPTVSAKVDLNGEFTVRREEVVVAAKQAGRREVRVWIEDDGVAVLAERGERFPEVPRESLESAAYASTLTQPHLVVLEDASRDDGEALRSLAYSVFGEVKSFDLSEDDGAVVVLFEADTPLGDPRWPGPWLAELREAAVEGGYRVRSYQGVAFPP